MVNPRVAAPFLYVAVIALAAGAVLSASRRVGGVSEPSVIGRPVGHDGPSKGAPVPSFGRDIRPILADRCFQCHGQDTAKRRVGLRLDRREDATAERKSEARNGAKEASPAVVKAIVPGDLQASEVWRRITSTDPAIRMPPPESGKRPLSEQERDLVGRWIGAGAQYEPHWAFVPPVRPTLPEVRGAAWTRNAIDRFVLARLEKDSIAQSPEASKPVLLRRMFLDLTGLPPTPGELDDFLSDARPDAYERWVDRLLTTEPYRSRYAERMASPWMDQSRYADTCGIHMDAGRQMWLWRDYVLHAFRDNLPFDRFMTEQLAGDLIPDATDDQKIASGFNRNHVTTDEGGAIAEEYLVEYAVDRTATTGSVFMGLTVGCARCHDHKFDPVTNEDFYSMYAFFNSIEEPGLYSQTTDAGRAHEPFMLVPTAQQRATLTLLNGELAALKEKQEQRSPGEERQFAAFLRQIADRSGAAWAESRVIAAASTGGSTLEAQPDGSVRASGENPKKDEHTITLRTDATGLRLLTLEALPEPTAPQGRVGRAFNGNAVLTGVTLEAVSVVDPLQRKAVKLTWAWADHSQPDGDHNISNAIDNDPSRGWAVDAHRRPGGRVALMLAEEPFGFDGGTNLEIKLQYQSMYDQHTLARVRLSVGTLGDAGRELLPLAVSRWYTVGPLPPQAENKVYEPTYGPEEGDTIDFKRNFGSGNQYWHFDLNLADERVVALADGRNVTYLGRYIYAPTARTIDVSLGSDDAFRLYVNGVEVASHNIERAVAADQDKATIPLRAGRNAVVLKIVNTGGASGYYYRATERAELAGDLVAALLSDNVRAGDLEGRLERAWRSAFLPSYREAAARITALEKDATEINAAVPRTMVMKEMDKPRETFVLTRGQYDKADKSRPVHRAVPAALGALPPGAPQNRLGLAQWLTSEENPLTARVTVNRLWEQFFGVGIVKTSEDFGLQGEWPSHPELLDWLAAEFREGGGGWDLRHIVKLIVTSSTYRQSSVVRPELAEKDPENRLLAFFPRHRLTAEQIRDEALYVSGLLVESLGGPSVKPYQPEGLWQEVAMPQSNTREYKRGMGTDLWRRSLYTYWKRALPPPSMLTFDAPTREACTIRRGGTSTPLQALVLWNDEQFVEAARALALRTLKEPGDDRARLSMMFRRCTSREPGEKEIASLTAAITQFRARYHEAPADADGLLKAGESPVPPDTDRPELAAWTMVASALLNLYQATTQE